MPHRNRAQIFQYNQFDKGKPLRALYLRALLPGV